MKLIILAAGQGTRLKPLTENKPKCLTPLLKKPLLEWQIETARASGIDEIVVVGGYKYEQLEKYPIKLVKNDLFMSTNMVHSLFCAKSYFDDDIIISYGDIVYEQSVLEKLKDSSFDITVVIDDFWRAYWEMRFDDPLSDAESLEYYPDGRIKNIGQKVKNLNEIMGQYIGLSFYRKEGIKELVRMYEMLCAQCDNMHKINNLYMTDLIQEMINHHISIHPLHIQRGWYEIDNLADLAIAEKYVPQGNFVKFEESYT